MVRKQANEQKEAVSLLMRLLAVDGITGKEGRIASEIVRSLYEAGVSKKQIKIDKANESIPLPTESGNVIVNFPGNAKGERLLFSTHMDTVPLCGGAVPLMKGGRIVPKGETALGGDNRTGVGVLIYLAKKLISSDQPYPPITLFFSVREESGLYGARYVNPADLGSPAMGFNVDGKKAEEFTIGAVGAERFEVEIFGKASHAGVHPEKGISATLVASLGLSQIHSQGWFGKVSKTEGVGTSNIGVFSGKNLQSAGDATNVVTDFVYLKGEARSHDPKFTRKIREEYEKAFKWAGGQVKNHQGKTAKIRFKSSLDYHPFLLEENSPVVLHAIKVAAGLGWNPWLKVGNGGLDANWIVRHGIPTITFGAGQNNIHTVDEYVQVDDYWRGCQLAYALATAGNTVAGGSRSF